MNLDNLHKRQRRYAAVLRAKGKITAKEFGMMLSGRLEYSPGCGQLYGWQERSPYVRGWLKRERYRYIGRAA